MPIAHKYMDNIQSHLKVAFKVITFSTQYDADRCKPPIGVRGGAPTTRRFGDIWSQQTAFLAYESLVGV